jgi:hypothetical protein
MGLDGQTRFQGLLGCSCIDHHLGESRGLLPSRAELDVVRPREGFGHLLGGLANVVAKNRARQDKTRDSRRVDARLGTVSRLSGSYPRRPATQAAPDNLARMSTALATSRPEQDRWLAIRAPAMLRHLRDTSKRSCNRWRTAARQDYRP